jgi:hypothetical protein
MSLAHNFLDSYFEPVVSVFTPELAEKIVNLKPDPKAVARVAELATKSDEGTITEEERDELEGYVDSGDFISLLKSKARRYLAEHGR